MVDAISYEDLVRFLGYCKQGRGVQARTLKAYTGYLRSFFGWCEAVGYIDRSPARALTSPKYIEPPKTVLGVPVAHLRQMLDFTEQASPRNYAILLFMMVTGCRVSATSNLLCGNLDLQQGSALVFEKGQRWVTYEFDELTAGALSNWLVQRPNAKHDYVWTGPGPKYVQFRATGIRKMLSDLCVRLRLPHYTPHQLRHSVGEIIANHDHSELAVATALNHKNLQSARIYMPQRIQRTRVMRREIESTLYPERAAKGKTELQETVAVKT
ncbi:tyrosine-type recombinase/integrase [Phototrophicus methaneseepsis]|uniref:Tyrosine-type recombinase/integrase n=1 Tax=Phototrophicus methaneseepsis TaxID=2710758 RepID=A0A7S8E5A6_9CHLR|nr:tyrosine-type recombinase/integrase [Phototrophicus methaneseepsis]QPC80621.1 tyrosine-type recombinase/integrase [Phototrophicus methaneseepsis]